MNHSKKLLVAAAAVTAASVPTFALAAGPAFSLPTAEVTGYITTTLAFIAVIGGGILGLVFAAKAWKWARKAG